MLCIVSVGSSTSGLPFPTFLFNFTNMEAAVGNYDFIFWHFKLVSDAQDNPLRDRLERFISDIKADLQYASGNLKTTIQEKLPTIFDLRLDALRILVNKRVDIFDTYSQKIYPYFEHLRTIKNYSSLAENLITSFLLNKAIIESLNRKSDFLTEPAKIKIPNVSFDQLQSTIYFGTPNYEIASALVDWIKCSLFIEYITIATCTMYEERLLVSQEKIDEVSNLLDETNLAYAGLATEFSIITYPDKILNLPKSNPKGAAYFKRMLDEKNIIHQHLKQGGNLSELKDKFNFVNPLSFRNK